MYPIITTERLTIPNMATANCDTEAPRKKLKGWNVPSASVNGILSCEQKIFGVDEEKCQKDLLDIG
jgi:hypothetical protein